ncbi:MAG: HNH endonuclease [Gemmataceae bacterium]
MKAGDPMAHRNWTRPETLAAFALYCRLPFGRLHARNPEIIALAERVGRTASAVAMKCCNLASLDETHQLRGVAGLTGVSALDREIWAEFVQAPEAVGVEAVLTLTRFLGGTQEPKIENGLEPTTVTEREAVVRVRIAQRFFREMILTSYGGRCAVCGLGLRELVVAAHIVPWSADPHSRLNPRNGICLCGTHDTAYERGVIEIDADCRISIASPFLESVQASPASEWLLRYDGRLILMPDRWSPDPRFLVARKQYLASRATQPQ